MLDCSPTNGCGQVSYIIPRIVPYFLRAVFNLGRLVLLKIQVLDTINSPINVRNQIQFDGGNFACSKERGRSSNGRASDSRSEGCVFKSRRPQNFLIF